MLDSSKYNSINSFFLNKNRVKLFSFSSLLGLALGLGYGSLTSEDPVMEIHAQKYNVVTQEVVK